jgi:hypothetical protein
MYSVSRGASMLSIGDITYLRHCLKFNLQAPHVALAYNLLRVSEKQH